MKNSRQSDRDLAKVMGVSQPTVTRVRNKLETERYFSEYTAIPNFKKLGYHLLAITFVSLKETLKIEQVQEAIKGLPTIVNKARENFPNIIMIERGVGLGSTAVVISYHKDYSSYSKLLDATKRNPLLNLKTQNFLINLDDELRYQPLTMSTLARDIGTSSEES
jgi:hypothetical protein